MSYLLRTLPVFGLTIWLSKMALAHPGHGASESAPMHYLTEPVHAVWIAAVCVLASLAVCTLAARRSGTRERSS